MIAKLYNWFHRFASVPSERGEYSSGYWSELVRRQVTEMSSLDKGRYLEIGCGEGLFLKQFAQKNPFPRGFGMDNNLARLSLARERFNKAGITNIGLSLQDALRLSFKNESFDLVICIGVVFNLKYFSCVEELVSEASRVSKEGATFVIEFRNSLNPLLFFKYLLAPYYDRSIREQGLPLKTYSLSRISRLLEHHNFKPVKVVPVGLRTKLFSPVITVYARKI